MFQNTENAEVWIGYLEKRIKNQSRIWRQLRNQIVGQTGKPEMMELERVEMLKSKAREQVRDLIESSITDINNEHFLEQALCHYLKKRPDAAHAMKLAVNRVCIHPSIRFYSWRALLSRDVIEPPSVVNLLQLGVFERCLDFVSTYPSLSFVVPNFPLLRLMEEFSKTSNLSLQHSIAIAVPLLAVIKDDLQSVDAMKMYKNIVYSLENSIQNVEALIEKQTRLIISELKLIDPSLYQSLVSLGFVKTQNLVKVLLSTMFIGPCKFETTLHIFDQFIQCSLDISNDPILPRVEKWITWICASFFMLYRGQFLENTDNGDQLHEYFTKSVSRVSASDLAATLERYFIKLVRDVLISEIIPVHHSSSNLDDVVSVGEDDLIELEEPVYETELKVWRKKIIAQRKVRLKKLMQRWKLLAKSIVNWLKFINYVKGNVQDRKKAELAANVRKESISLPVIPLLSKDKPVTEQSRKLPSGIFTALGTEGNIELSLAGTIMQNLVTTTSFLFGSESTHFLDQKEDLDEFMPSPFLEKTSTGVVELNPAGDLLSVLISITDIILT